MAAKTALFAAAGFGIAIAGGVAAYVALSGRPLRPATPAEQLMADNLYMPNGLYHVADLQGRPGVAAALARLRAANICDLFYRMRTTKMSSDVRKARLCAPPAQGASPSSERAAVGFEERALYPTYPQPPRFGVFSAADGTQYLIADGKNGSVGADEMERVVVTVIDNAIAALPAALAQVRAREESAERARKAAEDGRRKAQESFK
ncbi:hypothetical protein [Sorangium sp. So ce131]|uniref:hypothetical protein n=1 Tax=Sorangium sp. So ce131 TaxID=3133282 RepID=UPI003F60B2C9